MLIIIRSTGAQPTQKTEISASKLQMLFDKQTYSELLDGWEVRNPVQPELKYTRG